MPKLHILGGGVVELRQPLHPETHQNVRLVVDNDAAGDVDTDWLADKMRFVPEVPAEPAEWKDHDFDAARAEAKATFDAWEKLSAEGDMGDAD